MVLATCAARNSTANSGLGVAWLATNVGRRAIEHFPAHDHNWAAIFYLPRMATKEH